MRFWKPVVILFDILNEEKFLLPNLGVFKLRFLGTHAKYVENHLGRIRLASPLFIVSTPSRLGDFRIDKASYQLVVENSQIWQTLQGCFF